MDIRSFVEFCLIFTLTGCGVAAAESMVTGSAGPAIASSGNAAAPPAFYDFCNRYRRLCASGGSSRPVRLTRERARQLTAVNVTVNRSVREEPDIRTEGAEDVWMPATSVGDCEDIAILKKKRLLARGWPASSLLLTVVRPRFGNAGHTVLDVRTDHGDFILDNMSDSVRNWSNTPYRYYARQSVRRTGAWEFIDNAARTTASAGPQAVGGTRP